MFSKDNFMIENRFSLIDTPWIPIADVGRVSLKQIFTEPTYRALGGNPVQKIALMKLLLAIAQAACTPKDDNDWKDLGSKGLAQNCLTYLEKHHDKFYLYGENPFLQMPAVVDLIATRTEKRKAKAKNDSERLKAQESGKPKSFGAGFYPDLPSENNTMLSHTLVERTLSDAEKALFIISIMNFALGGKRVEADLVNLSGDNYGGLYSAKSAPSLGNYVGYLHSFLTGENLLSTLWLNLLTHEQIQGNKYWQGLGVPPWEVMPKTETCAVAEQLKNSYMGCLVAMSRFAFLKDEGVYYLDGIQYPNHSSGWREPSMTINSQQGIKVLWLNPDKRPWRELTALLSFIDATASGGFDCQQINFGFLRARKNNQAIGIWSGGLKVRGNAGDQSVKQNDDFVESHVSIPSNKEMEELRWFDNLTSEMAEIEQLSNIVYKTTMSYYKSQKAEGKNQAAMASNLFWQLSERKFQDLVNACGQGEEQTKALRKDFAQFASTAYNTHCANDTARQLNAWAENLPNLSKYLKNGKQPEAKA
jgi:CRISPR system Cascade subunit CasA